MKQKMFWNVEFKEREIVVKIQNDAELMGKIRNFLECEHLQLEELHVIFYAISKKMAGDIPNIAITPIREMIASEGIGVYERILTSVDDHFSNELLGTLERMQGEWRIYINRDIGPLTKRYAMAHEYARYLIYSISGHVKDGECTDVLLTRGVEEQMCDIMVSFLLLPFCMVVHLMSDYVRKQQCSYKKAAHSDEWMHYLGNEMELTDRHTILCYQNVQYLAGALHQYKQMRGRRKRLSRFLREIEIDLTEEIRLLEQNEAFFQKL